MVLAFGDSLTQRSQRSLYYLLAQATWQINEQTRTFLSIGSTIIFTNKYYVDDNGLNPHWECTGSPSNDSSFDFDIHFPATAFLRFTVYDQDMFGDPNFLAQSVIPVPCIKPGNWESIHK